MLRATFMGFKVATGALTTNQRQLDVVGQNISNINTKGYTRQRLDISSIGSNTKNVQFGTNDVIIGQGVKASGLSQYRDSFLDLRFRNESAKVGEEEVKLAAYSDLETVFDEISTDGLDVKFTELLEQFNALTSSPSDPVLEGVVRTSAEMLTQTFNDYANQIKEISSQQESYLRDGAIENINQLVSGISEYNMEIRQNNIAGNNALELQDKRNALIDGLSNYLDIKVNITKEHVGANVYIDNLQIVLNDITPEFELVNIGKHVELGVGSGADGTLINNITYVADGTKIETDITSSIKSGKVKGFLDFLNGSGEFTNTTNNVKGIIYYENMLNSVASTFANGLNGLNTDVDEDNYPFFDTVDGSEVFTAENIKVTDDWLTSSESYIINSNKASEGDNTGATDNIIRMMGKFSEIVDFTTTGDDTGTKLFRGTFQEMLSFATTRLNLEIKNTDIAHSTFLDTRNQIDYARQSISSVDLNEEGVNLLQYSKSYSAAARLMTTLDEMLNTLINEMAR